MDSQRRTKRADSRRCTGRRQFLGALGAVAAFGAAGCVGFGSTAVGGDGDDGSNGVGGNGEDTSGNGDSGDGSTGSDDQGGETGDDGGSAGDASVGEQAGDGAGSLACADLTAGYTSYSAGDRPLIVDIDVPKVLADEVEYMDAVDMVTAVRQISPEGSAQFALSIVWLEDGTESPRAMLDSEETVTDIEFDGETRSVLKMTRVDRPEIEQLKVAIPYDAGDGRKYYEVTVQMEVEMAGDFDVDDACGDALEEAARHVAESLRPNPDSTFDGGEQAAL